MTGKIYDLVQTNEVSLEDRIRITLIAEGKIPQGFKLEQLLGHLLRDVEEWQRDNAPLKYKK